MRFYGLELGGRQWGGRVNKGGSERDRDKPKVLIDS